MFFAFLENRHFVWGTIGPTTVGAMGPKDEKVTRWVLYRDTLRSESIGLTSPLQRRSDALYYLRRRIVVNLDAVQPFRIRARDRTLRFERCSGCAALQFDPDAHSGCAENSQ